MRPLNKLVLTSVLCSAAWAYVGVAQAQTPPPSTAEPGKADQRFRQDARPSVGGDIVITLPDDSGAKPLPEGVNFTLTSVTFENRTVFSEEELQEVVKPYVGQKVSLRTLNEIASKITAKYRNAGYILSRAVIPPQRIGDGNVNIRIIEGFVSEVRFEGLPEESGLLNSYADKIRAAKPLNAALLERYLLLMEDLPGVSARAVLRPSATVQGASDVIVTISQKHFDGSLSLDNRGSRYLGPYQAGLSANANNVLGWYERTQFRGAVSSDLEELQYGELIHEEQVGSEGTKVAVSASFARTQPGSIIEAFDIEGQNRFYAIAVTHPFIRSRQANLFGNVKFDVRDTDVSSLDIKLYEDKLQVLRIGGAYDFVDGWAAINRMEATIHRGLDFDHSSAVGARSRANGHPEFLKATAQVSRLQPIDGPLGLYLAATGQVSADPLLAAEEIGIGGPTFGSAYDTAELTGDSGGAVRAELQYSDTSGWEIVPNYQLYSFYDYGKVWNRHALAAETGEKSLSSVGIGSRFNVLDAVSGELEVALPLTKDVAAYGPDGDEPRVFFSLSYRY